MVSNQKGEKSKKGGAGACSPQKSLKTRCKIAKGGYARLVRSPILPRFIPFNRRKDQSTIPHYIKKKNPAKSNKAKKLEAMFPPLGERFSAVDIKFRKFEKKQQNKNIYFSEKVYSCCFIFMKVS